MERWRDGQGGGGLDNKRKDSRATAPSKDNTVPCGYLLSPEFFPFFLVQSDKGLHQILCLMPVDMSSFMYTVVLKPEAAV